MGGQAGNTSAMRGGGAGNPAAPYAGLPQAGMQANRDSMARRFGTAMRPPGSGMQSSGGMQPIGGGGTQGPGGISGGSDMATAGGTPGFDMRGPRMGIPGGETRGQEFDLNMQPIRPPGMPGNPGPGGPGMGNPSGHQQPDFSSLIQAMGQPKPMMQGGTGAMPMPGGLQSSPAPNQWNTTGRDQAMRLLGSSSGRSPYRP